MCKQQNPHIQLPIFVLEASAEAQRRKEAEAQATDKHAVLSRVAANLELMYCMKYIGNSKLHADALPIGSSRHSKVLP